MKQGGEYRTAARGRRVGGTQPVGMGMSRWRGNTARRRVDKPVEGEHGPSAWG